MLQITDCVQESKQTLFVLKITSLKNLCLVSFINFGVDSSIDLRIVNVQKAAVQRCSYERCSENMQHLWTSASECVRHLNVRIGEHVGISPLIKKKVKPKSSVVSYRL